MTYTMPLIKEKDRVTIQDQQANIMEAGVQILLISFPPTSVIPFLLILRLTEACFMNCQEMFTKF